MRWRVCEGRGEGANRYWSFFRQPPPYRIYPHIPFIFLMRSKRLNKKIKTKNLSLPCRWIETHFWFIVSSRTHTLLQRGTAQSVPAASVVLLHSSSLTIPLLLFFPLSSTIVAWLVPFLLPPSSPFLFIGPALDRVKERGTRAPKNALVALLSLSSSFRLSPCIACAQSHIINPIPHHLLSLPLYLHLSSFVCSPSIIIRISFLFVCLVHAHTKTAHPNFHIT